MRAIYLLFRDTDGLRSRSFVPIPGYHFTESDAAKKANELSREAVLEGKDSEILIFKCQLITKVESEIITESTSELDQPPGSV